MVILSISIAESTKFHNEKQKKSTLAIYRLLFLFNFSSLEGSSPSTLLPLSATKPE
jgi:hypothetical protein